MKLLNFQYRMKLQLEKPIISHQFALRFIPQSDDIQQIIVRQRLVEPAEWITASKDAFGNLTYVGGCRAPHTSFSYEVSGSARVNLMNRMYQECNPLYYYETLLTRKDCVIQNFQQQYCETMQGNVLSQAEEIMQMIFEHFTYQPGTTTITTTAGEALHAGCGVCQDYTHIFIALCRSCKIPTRYVAGMLIGEGATHAWAEVYNGTTWTGFDPTHNRIVDEGYIKLSHGRDYADCVIDKGIFKGDTKQNQKIRVSVEEIG